MAKKFHYSSRLLPSFSLHFPKRNWQDTRWHEACREYFRQCVKAAVKIFSSLARPFLLISAQNLVRLFRKKVFHCHAAESPPNSCRKRPVTLTCVKVDKCASGNDIWAINQSCTRLSSRLPSFLPLSLPVRRRMAFSSSSARGRALINASLSD